MSDTKKTRFVQIERPGLGSFTVSAAELLAILADELEDDLAGDTEAGEKVILTFCDMTTDEYDELPEFTGW